jgi:methyl-accepting chemotaxis protein
MSEVFQWVMGGAAVVACLAVVGQLLILAAIYRAGKEAQSAGQEVGTKLAPLVDRFEGLLTAFNNFLTTSGKMLEENRPRLAAITSETLVVAKTVRQHAEVVGELIDDTSGRAQARIAQIDRTLEQTVAQVEHASEAVKGAVLRPVKEVNGIVAGVKAAFNTYAQGGNRNSPEHATQDEEMFI